MPWATEAREERSREMKVRGTVGWLELMEEMRVWAAEALRPVK
jgi:hypothetical protein